MEEKTLWNWQLVDGYSRKLLLFQSHNRLEKGTLKLHYFFSAGREVSRNEATTAVAKLKGEFFSVLDILMVKVL